MCWVDSRKIGNIYTDTGHPKYGKTDFKYITKDGIASISLNVKPLLGTNEGCDTLAFWKYTDRSWECWQRELRVGDVVEFEVVAYISAKEVKRRVVKDKSGKWYIFKLNEDEQKN